jgi:chromosome segregation ATPase
MTPEQQKRLHELSKVWDSWAESPEANQQDLAIADALRAALAEISRLREENDALREESSHSVNDWNDMADLANQHRHERDEARSEATRLREERDNPKCTRVCQVPCCGQTILDRTPSGQIPCGDY